LLNLGFTTVLTCSSGQPLRQLQQSRQQQVLRQRQPVQAQQARLPPLALPGSRFGCSFNRSGFNSDRLDRSSHRSNNFLCNLDRSHGNFSFGNRSTATSFCSHGNGSSGSHTSNSHFGSHIACGSFSHLSGAITFDVVTTTITTATTTTTTFTTLLLLGRLGGSFHAFGAVQVQFFLCGSYRLVSLVALGLLAAAGRLLSGLRCSLLVTLFSLRAGILFTRFAVFTRLASRR
jgi:hypothetical protein